MSNIRINYLSNRLVPNIVEPAPAIDDTAGYNFGNKSNVIKHPNFSTEKNSVFQQILDIEIKKIEESENIKKK